MPRPISRVFRRPRAPRAPGGQMVMGHGLTSNGIPDLYIDKPFPRIRAQMAPGADPLSDPSTWSWQDFPTEMNAIQTRQGIVISRRTRRLNSPLAALTPSTARWTCKNLDGALTQNNPNSPFYPYVDDGLPVRFFADYGAGEILRGTFMVDGIEPSWDETGRYALTSFQASGHLSRYNDGTRPSSSLLTTYNLQEPAPRAYWPMEDASGSVTFDEVMGNQPAMTWNEVAPSFASFGPPGSDSVAKLESLTELVVDLIPYTMQTTWTVACIAYIPVATVTDAYIIKIDSEGSLLDWRLTLRPTGGTDTIGLLAYDNDGVLVVNSFVNFTMSSVELYGKWCSFAISATQDGADIDWKFTFGEAGGSSTITSGTASTKTLGNPRRIGVHNGYVHPDWGYGHFGLWDSDVTYFTEAIAGFDEEEAGYRMQDALDFEDEPALTLVGNFTDTTPMGTWKVTDLAGTLKEGQEADGGMLYDALTPNVEYRTHHSLYNQDAAFTLDMGNGEVLPSFRPQRISSGLINEWTVTRSGGNSSQGGTRTVRDDALYARGRRSSSASLNLFEDAQALHSAGWLLNLTTDKEMAYRDISFSLFKNPELAESWCATMLGDRVDTIVTLDTHPPGTVKSIMEEYTEVLASLRWDVSISGTPYDPYEVFTVGQDTRGRVQTGGTTLGGDISSSALSMLLVSDADNLWTTTATFPADLPLDAMMGGEQVTISAITGTTSPQTATISVRSVNGIVKEHRAGTPIIVLGARPMAL